MARIQFTKLHPYEYNSFRAMNARCRDPKYVYYQRYGGRGIKVCDRWRNKQFGFKNFFEDMGEKPDKTYELDRIDNDGDYTPLNCRWVDKIQQRNNTCKNRFETLRGKTQTVAQWCREYGVPTHQIYNRMAKGWTFEGALTTPKITLRRKTEPR